MTKKPAVGGSIAHLRNRRQTNVASKHGLVGLTKKFTFRSKKSDYLGTSLGTPRKPRFLDWWEEEAGNPGLRNIVLLCPPS